MRFSRRGTDGKNVGRSAVAAPEFAGPARMEQLKSIEKSLSTLSRVLDQVMRRNQKMMADKDAQRLHSLQDPAAGGDSPAKTDAVARPGSSTGRASPFGDAKSKVVPNKGKPKVPPVASIISYRDSKLTQLLKPVFEGEARTMVLLTASPLARNAQTTRYTLRFGHALTRLTLTERREITRRSSVVGRAQSSRVMLEDALSSAVHAHRRASAADITAMSQLSGGDASSPTDLSLLDANADVQAKALAQEEGLRRGA